MKKVISYKNKSELQFHAQVKLFCWRWSLESNKRTLLFMLSICLWYSWCGLYKKNLVYMMKHFGGHNVIQIWRWIVDGLLYQERWSYKVTFLWALLECHDVHRQCEHEQSVLVMWWHHMQPHNLLFFAWNWLKIIITVKLVSVKPDICMCFAVLKVQYSITEMKQLS